MPNTPPAVSRATFTVNHWQDFQVGEQSGFKQPEFGALGVTQRHGKFVKVADIGNQSEARLSKRSDGKFDITVIHRGNGDLNGLKVTVQQGYVRRLTDTAGQVRKQSDPWLGHNPGKGFKVDFSQGNASALAAPDMPDDALLTHLEKTQHCDQPFVDAAKSLLERVDKLQKGLDRVSTKGLDDEDDSGTKIKTRLPHLGQLSAGTEMKRLILLASERNDTATLQKLEESLSFEGKTKGTSEEDRSDYRLLAFLAAARGLGGKSGGAGRPLDYDSIAARIHGLKDPANLSKLNKTDRNADDAFAGMRTLTVVLKSYDQELGRQFEQLKTSRQSGETSVKKYDDETLQAERERLDAELALGPVTINRIIDLLEAENALDSRARELASEAKVESSS